MKRISFILIALVAVSSFSCGLLEKADVSFDVTLPLDFTPINETAVNANGKAYTDSKVLDATQNSEVAKYKDKIKDFKVNKVYYEITEYVGSGVIFNNGSIKTGTSTIVTKTGLTLANTAKTEFTSSEVNVDGLNALAASLKADKQATVVFAGTFSKTPVAFKVRAYFDVTITASALK
jgi:hypothetical protein